MSKERGINLLKILVSLGLLGFLLRQTGWQQVWRTVTGAQWTYLVIAFALYLVGVGIRAYRWYILLRTLNIHISLGKLVKLYFIGMFFSNLLPTGIGGDAIRMYELYRESKKPAESVSTVLLDRATGLLMLFLIAMIALPFSYRLIPPRLSLIILVLCGGSWAGTGLLFWQNGREKVCILRFIEKVGALRKLYDAVIACGWKAFAGALGVSSLFNVLLIIVNYLIAISLGIRIPFWYFLLFIPLISFLLLVPFSVSGLGIREGGYVYLFAHAGISAPLALSMSLLFYLLNVATGLIGGVIYALEGAQRLRSPL